MSFNNSFTPNSTPTPPSAIAVSNSQTLNVQEFNNPDGSTRNYLSVGTVTQSAGTFRLTGSAVWKVI